MERRFNNEGFEKLLRDNANQYRMYPSEKVWESVHSALHTRRKWYIISALVLFIFTSAGLGLLFINKKGATESITKISSLDISSKKSDNIQIQNLKTGNPVNDLNKPSKLFIGTINTSDLKSVNPEIISNINKTDNPASSEKISASLQNDLGTSDLVNNTTLSTQSTTLLLKENYSDNSRNKLIRDQQDKINMPKELMIDQFDNRDLNEEIAAIESLSATLPVKKRLAKLTAQVFFTPTLSYRTLTDNKKYYSNGVSLISQALNLNNEVKHKPAIGLEFGLETKYRVNDNFYLKTGFQFNINRYDIRAFSHPTEIATIAVTNGYRTDSMATLSNYRNKGVVNANWLENFYFQAAFPVGAEIILSKQKKYNWGVSGTIQPTYVIGDKAYLISSDYRNYAKFPDLMRRWNVSTGFETFIGYSTGKINWQVGPHIRYQYLSSFKSSYPVKENLFAVGFKVAASFNKNK